MSIPSLFRFRKCGPISLACFICIVVFTDVLVQLNIVKPLSGHSDVPWSYHSNSNPSAASKRSIYFDPPSPSPLMTTISSLFPSTTESEADGVIITNSSSSTQTQLQVHPHKSFLSTLQHFPWLQFETYASKDDTENMLRLSKLFIDQLAHFLLLEPSHPINDSCKPPKLPSPDEIDCGKYPEAFNGDKRREPRKIGVLIQVGFDIDILEIHFNELVDVVDLFFVTEATQSHYKKIQKPLMWEHVKYQERFNKFPVVHFVVDDADGAKVSDNTWDMEYLQEKLRWEKFLEWNEATKYFGDEDLLGFGDTDEIPSRAKLHTLKYCEFSGVSIDFGIWSPFGHINQAFATDFPIREHPFTLGDPTYYKLKDAKLYASSINSSSNSTGYPSRRLGSSPNYLLGGIHMSHYGYLPFLLAKHATASEYGLRSLEQIRGISRYLISSSNSNSSLVNSSSIRQMEIDFGATPKISSYRIGKVRLTNPNPEVREICVLPWFYDCNRQRYPVWEDGHDTRLD